MNSTLSFKSAAPVVAALILAALALFAGLSSAADDKKPPPKPALTVTSGQPQQSRLPVRLAANGTITAWQDAIIGAEASGLRLTEVRVNVGDVVRKGQVLATFAGDAAKAEVAQARAALMEAEANAADAANNAERARTLSQTGALSTQQINQYLTTDKTAKAKAEAARATLNAQQLREKYTRVLAPDNGVISARTATVGAVVGTGTELFRMIRQGRLEWRAEVTSADLGRITVGTLATVTAASGAQLKGRVRTIAPTVDPLTRSALVYVDLPASPGNSMPAKAGMFARGEFELGSTAALTVPQQSVVVRDGFDYVFALGADNRTAQLKVQTGRRVGDQVEVLSGLKPDTRIAVQGAGFLNDGDLVKVVAPPAAAPAGAAPAAAK
ncbi:MAG: efflux RND transporter periplasmic adaptor subunit [Bdellovibrionales bacterium]|nr:efflux RND transporter periplasmic adaptor subunit [Ramlibacter sp.]